MPGDNQSNITDTLSTDDDAAARNFNKFDQLMMETRAVLLRYEYYKSTLTILKIEVPLFSENSFQLKSCFP